MKFFWENSTDCVRTFVAGSEVAINAVPCLTGPRVGWVDWIVSIDGLEVSTRFDQVLDAIGWIEGMI